MILAVLTSLAVPSYWRMHSKVKFDQAVQTVLQVMSSARELAIQTGADTTVKFDQQSETFTVTVETVDQSTDVPSQLQESQTNDQQTLQQPRMSRVSDEVGVVGFQVNQGSNYSQSANGPSNSAQGGNTLRFKPDGSCDGASFTIISTGNYRVNVEVSALTGKASIKEDFEQ